MPGPADAFIGAFGATTALVVCGGAVLLRWQRAKLRHSLLLAGLERGITALPGMPPIWLASLRQGTSILVLGLVLMFVGAATIGSADKVPMPIGAAAIAPPADPAVRAQPEMSPDGRLRPAPPPEAPAMQEYHQAKDRRNAGMIGLICGLILAALGLVRVVFAGIERRYARAAGLTA